MLFDTHAHLNNPLLINNTDEIIKRSLEEGVTHINVVGYDLFTSQLAVEVASKYPQVYASVGIHPTEVGKADEGDFEKIVQLLNHPKVIALGEIGLDYYHDDSSKQVQKDFLIKFLQLAHQTNKPVVIHVRDALQDIYNIFVDYKDILTKGVMHCYSGSAQMANDFIKLGFYIGLDGPVTFKNARVPKEVALQVPLENLVVETDCPYLAPHPFRGKQNEPSLLPLIRRSLSNSVKKVAYFKNPNLSPTFAID